MMADLLGRRPLICNPEPGGFELVPLIVLRISLPRAAGKGPQKPASDR